MSGLSERLVRRFVLAALASAAVVAVLPDLPGTPAGAGTDPEALLERAREASATTTVEGQVEVRWLDGETEQVERTAARARRGSYVVGTGEHYVVGDGDTRWGADDGIATRWGRAGGDEPPRPGAAWDLALADDAEFAGRPVHVVVARDGDGPVRARFYVDDDSGLLVRRDVLARDGTIVRSVRFTRLALDGIVPAVPANPEEGPQPVATDEVGEGFVAPDTLASHFRLLGRYRHPDGAVQLFYSDGLFSLSVFELPGVVDWAALPDGGRWSSVESERARWYATDAGSVVVWGSAGLVLTGVSDAPPDTVRVAVADVIDDGNNLLDDVADFILGPFGWE